METAKKRYEFDGFFAELSAPVEVGRSKGHFWFSSLHPLEGQEVLCEVVRTDDRAQGEWPATLCLSQDGGQTWRRVCDIDCNGPQSLRLGPRRLLLMPYELWPAAPGERRNAVANGTVLSCAEDGAVAAERVPVRFEDFPRDLDDYHEGELRLMTNGNILPLRDGRLFTTLYGRFAGEERTSVFAVTSEDGGFTWRFLSVVARPEGGAEVGGRPSESSTVRLDDGRLLCVYRVGSGMPYRKSYSPDEGLSWTPPVRLRDAWSVEPQLVRLDNGLLLLSGGRPGLLLWVCSDGEGERWQGINLGRHHNALFPDPALHYSEQFCEAERMCEPAQSTSYTGLVKTGPCEALLCYDRLGNGWQGAPGPWGDEDMVFCLKVRVCRT